MLLRRLLVYTSVPIVGNSRASRHLCAEERSFDGTAFHYTTKMSDLSFPCLFGRAAVDNGRRIHHMYTGTSRGLEFFLDNGQTKCRNQGSWCLYYYISFLWSCTVAHTRSVGGYHPGGRRASIPLQFSKESFKS